MLMASIKNKLHQEEISNLTNLIKINQHHLLPTALEQQLYFH
jgi:hypothetical protein